MTGTDDPAGRAIGASRRAWAKAWPYVAVLLAAAVAHPVAGMVWMFGWSGGFKHPYLCCPMAIGVPICGLMALSRWRFLLGVLGWVHARVVARREIPALIAAVAIPAMAWVGCGPDYARMEFRRHRAAFEQAASDAAAGVRPRTQVIGRWQVEDARADPRGGVYVATGYAPDIIIDVLTVGFVRNPNANGTPYGAARYELRHIEGDWYLFRASSDWR